MRRRYIVTYDIRDAKRWRRIFRKMHGYGDRLQLSVFVCDLSEKECADMRAALAKIIDTDEDGILIVDTGRVDGRGADAFKALGRQSVPAVAREALIV